MEISDYRNVMNTCQQKRYIEQLIRQALQEEAEIFAIRNADRIKQIAQRCLMIVRENKQ